MDFASFAVLGVFARNLLLFVVYLTRNLVSRKDAKHRKDCSTVNLLAITHLQTTPYLHNCH